MASSAVAQSAALTSGIGLNHQQRPRQPARLMKILKYRPNCGQGERDGMNAVNARLAGQWLGSAYFNVPGVPADQPRPLAEIPCAKTVRSPGS